MIRILMGVIFCLACALHPDLLCADDFVLVSRGQPAIAIHSLGENPDRTYEQFQHDRLVPCYGGTERATQFLKLLRSTPRVPAEIEAGRLQTISLRCADFRDASGVHSSIGQPPTNWPSFRK